jgi:hypothetical protein
MSLFRRTKRQPSEATKSRQRAEKALEQTRAETPKYAALSESLRREIRDANHLTELFLDLRRGGRT